MERDVGAKLDLFPYCDHLSKRLEFDGVSPMQLLSEAITIKLDLEGGKQLFHELRLGELNWHEPNGPGCRTSCIDVVVRPKKQHDIETHVDVSYCH